MPYEPRPDDLRQLQVLWGALVAGVGVMAAVFGALAVSGGREVEPDFAAALFYTSAAASMAAIVAAFWVQHRLRERLPRHGTYEEAMADLRTSGIVSLAIMEGAALVAAVAALVSGQLIPLLFLVPFFGFAAFFFPTETRVSALLRHVGRR